MKFLKKHAVSIFVTVLCLVTLILLFFKCVALDVSILDLKFTGFEVIFGLTETQGSVIELNVDVLDFSLMAFLGLALLLVGVVLTWLAILPMSNVITAVVLIASGIILFCFPNVILFSEGFKDLYYNFQLSCVGEPVLYVAAILPIIAGLLALVQPFLKTNSKKKKR